MKEQKTVSQAFASSSDTARLMTDKPKGRRPAAAAKTGTTRSTAGKAKAKPKSSTRQHGPADAEKPKKAAARKPRATKAKAEETTPKTTTRRKKSTEEATKPTRRVAAKKDTTAADKPTARRTKAATEAAKPARRTTARKTAEGAATAKKPTTTRRTKPAGEKSEPKPRTSTRAGAKRGTAEDKPTPRRSTTRAAGKAEEKPIRGRKTTATRGRAGADDSAKPRAKRTLKGNDASLEPAKNKAPKSPRKPSYDLKKMQEIAQKKGQNKPMGPTRLNKFIANAGICSRREADTLIAAGEVKVNGKIVTEMGYKVEKGDEVKYKGKSISGEAPAYVLLNKPKDFITTMHDPEGRKIVMDLVKGAAAERLYPVGRLDRPTTGLLLFTNDGELAKKLTHPSHKVQKLYEVTLDRPITKEDFVKLENGLELEDGLAKPVDVAIVGGGNDSIVGIEVHMGRNRIVRRMFEHLGYRVEKLDRVMYAGLTKKDIARGQWRYLSEKEVIQLKYFI